MALGRYPDRTLLVEIGKVKQFSDISGLHVVRLTNAPEKRLDVANRLRRAGCSVSTESADWTKSGDFDYETPNVESGPSPAMAIGNDADPAWQIFGKKGSGTYEFSTPNGIALDERGRIYIADDGNNRIVRMDDMRGTNWTTLGGTQGRDQNQFCLPTGIAVDGNGRIYVADEGNNRIVFVSDITGAGWKSFGVPPASQSCPAGVWVDASGHNIYVADLTCGHIGLMNDIAGTGWRTFGNRGGAENQFNNPWGVTLGPAGHIYVADSGNSRIVRMNDIEGTGWTTIGSLGSGINQFSQPPGIAVDALGRIYVADYANNRIVRMNDMDGTGWTVCLGKGNDRFRRPNAVALDAGGYVYVTDQDNNRIVRFMMQ